jgi:hypothetical protein
MIQCSNSLFHQFILSIIDLSHLNRLICLLINCSLSWWGLLPSACSCSCSSKKWEEPYWWVVKFQAGGDSTSRESTIFNPVVWEWSIWFFATIGSICWCWVGNGTKYWKQWRNVPFRFVEQVQKQGLCLLVLSKDYWLCISMCLLFRSCRSQGCLPHAYICYLW